jgi:hypothetical protein
MKMIVSAALLAVSALSGLDPVKVAQLESCAQRLVGKQVLGVGKVSVAAPDAEGKYQVQIAGEGDKAIVMVLTQDQLCELAETVEPTRP